MGFLQRQTELTTFLGLLPHSFLSPSTASGKSVVSSVAFRTTTDDEMAEVQGIEPSTLRWHGFQDRLSTLLAYLQNSMRVPQRVTHNHTGRRCRIRTCDPLLPKQMRYQTALISVSLVLRQGIDPWSLDYQSSALPLSYRREFIW